MPVPAYVANRNKTQNSLMKKVIILTLLFVGSLWCVTAQESRVVTGRVLDENGMPMMGAVVEVLGTNNATTTDIEGIYTLKGVSTTDTIRASFLGYENSDKKADDVRIDFDLQPSAQEIASVVVTGMQKMDKRIFTGATDQLMAEDVKLNGVGEISRSLEGRSAAYRCRMSRVRSAPPRRSAYVEHRPSTETPSLCGLSTVSSWRTWST